MLDIWKYLKVCVINRPPIRKVYERKNKDGPNDPIGPAHVS